MAKTDNWQRRKRPERGFDDSPSFPDPFPPVAAPSFARRPSSPAPMSTGPDTSAVVKWFNSEKGFGFVELEGGAGDVFLHASVLTRIGASAVNPGATLRVRVGQGQKGPQVTEVLEIDDSTAGAAPAPRAPRPGGAPGGFGGPRAGGGFAPSGTPGPETQGTVKWYNSAKGFGFVAPDDGGKDVFVHASALRRAGLVELAEGQKVTLQIVQGQKGPEAASISVG